MEKIVIIGGGVGGLSAGIYALLAGFDVEIYEKNAVPGGECTGWNRKEFHIDNCIHWLTGTKRELIDFSPEDADEIEKFIQYVEYSKQCVFPAKKPMDMWRVKDYIAYGMSMKDFAGVSKEFGNVSLEEYSKRFKHPAIQKLMCDYLPREYCVYSFFVSYATMADGNGDLCDRFQYTVFKADRSQIHAEGITDCL